MVVHVCPVSQTLVFASVFPLHNLFDDYHSHLLSPFAAVSNKAGSKPEPERRVTFIPDSRRNVLRSRTTNDALAIMEAEYPLTTPPHSSSPIPNLSLARYTMVGHNIAIPLPLPYQTPWTWHPGSWWSKNLIEGRKFDELDGVFFASTVDYAMKLYISAEMQEPFAATLKTLNTSELAWAIVLAGRSYAEKCVRDKDALPARERTRKRNLLNFQALTYALPGIRERFDITI
jgi:hypothetical protein